MAACRSQLDRLLSTAHCARLRVASRQLAYGGRRRIAIDRSACAYGVHRIKLQTQCYAAKPRQQQQRQFSTPTSSSTTPISPSPPSAIPPFAFAFDIDGVLLHVNQPIPGAAAALQHLHRLNIPFILLTNGGGRYEADRVADLQQRLGLDSMQTRTDAHDPDCAGPLPILSTANFVQSHTPFQELLDNAAGLDDGAGGDEISSGSDGGLRGQTILVTGSDAARVRTIAERYGFRNVIIPADILAAYPAIYPFNPLLKSVYAETARPLPKPLLLEGGNLAVNSGEKALSDTDESNYLRIAAAFVFNDPRDWALDIQILTDMLQARRGLLGTFDPASLSAKGSEGGTRLFFSNSDLLWAAKYHLPRFGQGAFAAAVAGVWAQMVSTEQPPLLSPKGGRSTLLGKPNAATYRFAERTLRQYRASLLEAHASQASPAAKDAPLQTVYMVGDNPDSDIAGANQFSSAHGTDWCSVLVETGVYDPARDKSSPDYLRHRPRAIVNDVRAAVRWALQREGWPAEF
ncbi:hypothetical protein SEPCBS57363_006192 [Sporothrix epigloea]|uniref:HAD superfamily hydrolase n=1 Tax=Sporothrix epigloea TaxID=1892477 RepID=A0ABP0E1Q7_9PEZI